MNRRRLLVTACALTAAPFLAKRPAFALFGVGDTVFCVNCSTMLTQLAQLGKEAASLESQVQSHVTQLQQYAAQLQNMVALPTQVWGAAQSDLMQVRNIANAGSLLSGNAGSLIARLQSASGYASQVGNMPGNIGSQFTMWQQTIGNNLGTFAKTLGLQQSEQANDAALLTAMQRQSQSATGQLAAIQAGNELGAMTAQQLMQVQQTIATQGQVQAAWIAVQADRQATDDAARQRYFTPQLQPTSGGQGF